MLIHRERRTSIITSSNPTSQQTTVHPVSTPYQMLEIRSRRWLFAPPERQDERCNATRSRHNQAPASELVLREPLSVGNESGSLSPYSSSRAGRPSLTCSSPVWSVNRSPSMMTRIGLSRSRYRLILMAVPPGATCAGWCCVSPPFGHPPIKTVS
jgi:hypothetical protein